MTSTPRRSLGWAALLAALPCLLASTCTAPAIRVVAPTPGDAVTFMPLTLEIEYSAQAVPGSLDVRLNGIDVTDDFVAQPALGGRIRAVAESVWGSALVLAGANRLVASVEVLGEVRATVRDFSADGDAYADAVDGYTLGSSGGFNVGLLPDVVLGAPAGSGLFGGSLDTFSLGIDGEIVLEFTDNAIVDGPGVDFTVFENAFLREGAFQIIDGLFSEAGTVSVSQDGVSWWVFPCASTVDDSPFYPGCAGVYPVLANGETDTLHPSMPTETPPVEDFIGQIKPNIVVPDGSGGDSFDLADVGLGWARYVRIQAADHVVGPFGPDNAGFDLDAIAAVHSVPATDLDENGVPDAVE